ncbi:hypothetical protein Pcinc_012335 [Petrolisthes cinctipes]|uniref:Macroglobulin domain-containing protein n=1 Tax=Petrolisthes cinctipes TaxID=88211 RepID=A0AAE1KTM3_PETCI|nr:hypothetical protein Pcinc_012335 [Petrolisthes cinctipes]
MAQVIKEVQVSGIPVDSKTQALLKNTWMKYSEVWVTTPSRTRIAQWKNVTTSNGLIHLDFNLIDEPEEGTYTIHLRPPQGRKTTTQLKVEDFVLPLYEVTLRPPPYILATDDAFSFSVCAKYLVAQTLKQLQVNCK